MKVKDCKIDDEYQSVDAENDLSSVKNRYCHILIVVKNKKPVGIVTNNDIVRNIKNQNDYKRLKFKDIMSSPVTTIKEDEDLAKAGKLMYDKGYMSLPVVDDKGSLKGLLTYFDYLDKVAEKLKKLGKKK